MLLINCIISLDVTWSANIVICETNGATNFAICDTKLYVLVGTLSTEVNANLLQKLKSRFQRTINSVCNFQPMKILVELNQLLSKFFCYITWFLYQLIRRDTARLANEAFTSNPKTVQKLQTKLEKISIKNMKRSTKFIFRLLNQSQFLRSF